MKRTPLQRKTPLRRGGFKPQVLDKAEPPPLQPLATPPNYTGATSGEPVGKDSPVRDEAYRRWVASMPCLRCGAVGRTQACHANYGKGLSLKTSDLTCFPLCVECHREHDLCIGMTREERRQRESDYIATVRAMHAGEILPP